MLRGSLARRGYMRWWHSFSGVQAETGETRSFFIEFMILNPSLGGELPILGQHPYYKKRGMRPAYVLVKAGAFPDAEGNDGRQLHSFYPISSLKAAFKPFVMQVEDCFYSEDRLSGSVFVSEEEARHRSFMTDAGVMEWELEVHKAVSCHTGLLASPLFQAFNALDSYWHGEGIKTFFRGTVTLDGVAYDVSPDQCCGYADKHWGRSFNRPWLQFSCGRLTSQRSGRELRHSVLAINGCCPRFFFLPLRRKLLIQLTYTGEDYDFGIQPFLLSRCRWETKETNKRYIWHIMAQNKTSVIKISGSCSKAQMLRLRYENPDGVKSRQPLFTGAAAVGTIKLYRRTPEGLELLDTLQMQQGFCEYQGESLRGR
ncbi:MAG: hypothetical protein NC432_07775 [Roseburia sp.]|nr:hypothetical protein [Roseburia sp.]